MNRCIAITGATGFVGRHLYRALSNRPNVDIRLLFHYKTVANPIKKENITVLKGDLLKPETLLGFLQPGCTVVNLAYLSEASADDNLAAAANLADACLKAGIRRLIHCSTAVVVGRTSSNVITEKTICEPDCNYEITKLSIENIITEKARGHFDLAIIRPTAVFGPGGRNLLKLADELSSGNRVLNYLKSCLFDRRRMNLVSVDHVVAALIFLFYAEQKMAGDIYIVSDDDHPLNNYRDVEQYLVRALKCRDFPLPRIPLPPYVLSVMLKLAGRSNSNPLRRYDDEKLRAAGFRNTATFEAGLDLFAEWYKKQCEDPTIVSSQQLMNS